MSHNIAWIDLETTGTSHTAGSILEVGCLVTDRDGTVLGSFTRLVRPHPTHVARMDPVVVELHRTSGLLAEMEACDQRRRSADPGDAPTTTTDRELRAFLDPFAYRGQVILGGSGVGHFDQRWIRHHLPRTAKALTWWVYDVGVVRRFLSTVNPALVRPAPEKAHRGLADATDHAAEWFFYRDLLADCDPSGADR